MKDLNAKHEPVSGYSTKYAMTRGIEKVSIRPPLHYPEGYRIKYKDYVYTDDRCQLIYGHTFFESLEDAKDDARAQAQAKATSLEKQWRKMLELAVEPKIAGE